MATTIKIKHSTTAGNAPSSLAQGELAINVADGNLFYGDGSGVSQDFTVNTITAEQYIVSSSVTNVTFQQQSGSTIFGDSADDTHTFTGTVSASGDIYGSQYFVDGLSTINTPSTDTVRFGFSSFIDNIEYGKQPTTTHLFRGAITASNNISASGTITANLLTVDTLKLDNSELSSTANTDAFITLNANGIDFAAAAGDKFTFNQTNQDNIDFVVGGENDLNLIYADASTDKVGIGTNTPGEKLEVVGNISASGTITANSFTGNGLSIDGPSNSHVEVGTYPIGYDSIPFSGFYITGSGLIISGAMADTNHHNFLKIGEIEIVDVKNSLNANALLIHNVDDFILTSGSDGGNIVATNLLFRHQGNAFDIYQNGSSKISMASNGNLNFTGQTITFTANSATQMKAPNATSVSHILATAADPSSAPQDIKSVDADNFFTVVAGAVTASAVSSSGDLIGNTLDVQTNKLAKTSNTDADHQGDVVFFGSTTSMDAGKIYYYNSSGNWALTDADAESSADGLLAVALGAASDTNGMLIKGMVTLDHDPGTVGDPLYLSTTAGQASSTAPSATNDIVRLIGYCLDSTNGQIYFNPSNDYIVHA